MTNILQNYLPYLSSMYRNYMLIFLHEYDYDSEKRKFKDCLSINILPSFYHGLQSMLASIDAFQAAWDGNLSFVQEFLMKYPMLTDKPGLWGRTLLYSAAKNGHISIVKYLIETQKCSVNVQNEQHLEQSLLSTKIIASDYDVKSKAASTALHRACFNGYLEIVQYLVEHGADYFIKNQALKTPLMNIGSHDEI